MSGVARQHPLNASVQNSAFSSNSGSNARSELGGMRGVARHDGVVGCDGEEVGQLSASGELVEEADRFREMPAAPARLAQLPAILGELVSDESWTFYASWPSSPKSDSDES